MKRSKRIVITGRILSFLYIGAMLLFIVFSLFAKFGSHQSYGAFHLRTVLSSSMDPAIPTGSLIVLKEVATSELVVGDVIAFKASDDVVTHRINKVIDTVGEQRSFQTKGDNNQEIDAGMVQEILGKVWFHIPKLGIFFQIIQTPRGTWALLSTILTLLLLEQFLALLFEQDKKLQLNEVLIEKGMNET